MTAFRLTDGSAGCPPLEIPPRNYVNPFRMDENDSLWVNRCFKDFRYYGAARHDMPNPITIDLAGGQISTQDDIEAGGKGIAGGQYRSVAVKNDGRCPLGVVVGHDVGANMTTRGDNMIRWTIATYWNGVYQSQSSASSVWLDGNLAGFALITHNVWSSANPHDIGIEEDGEPNMVVQPGDTGVVSCRMFISYDIGGPDGTETINSGISAARVYGYNL